MVSILGQNIKKIRELKGYSAYKLAKKAEVGTTTISEIESGKRQGLNSKSIEKIANALAVTIDDLLATEVDQSFVATDIDQTFNIILSDDDIMLDDIVLTLDEKNKIKSALKVAYEIIRKDRESGK